MQGVEVWDVAASANISNDEWYQKILQITYTVYELLECPVCYNTMNVAFLKQCSNGHGVCSSCATCLNKCPLCRQALLFRLRQNTLLRQVLMYLPRYLCYFKQKYRIMDINWGGKVEMLASTVTKCLECPVCGNMMDATLKQCIIGHGVCSSCASKNLSNNLDLRKNSCPTCHKALVLELCHNTLLGQILEHLPRYCSYITKGCTVLLPDKEHETYCKYRPTECKVVYCTWKGCVMDLVAHVAKNHFFGDGEECVNTSQKCRFSFGLKESKAYFTPLIFQNQVFWKYFHWNGTTKCISHQLYYLATTKSITSHYYMIISLEEGNMKYERYCKAVSLDGEEHNKGVDSGLIIPDWELKQFLVPGSKKTYYYYLKLFIEDTP